MNRLNIILLQYYSFYRTRFETVCS